MHIPDGYLSPQTYVPLYIAFIGAVIIAVKRVKERLESRMVPFLGMAAAFSFLIMMFNIPIPGGTTGHAVGAAIISLILGPWITFISVSVALIIQALVFGDGGITAIGANCINMAFVMPFTAWILFKMLKGKNSSQSRILISAFIAAYISLNVSALVTAVEFGIQPLVARDTNGQALYAPFPLSIAIPAMVLEHLLLFGFVEAIITTLIFKYFIKSNVDMVEALKN